MRARFGESGAVGRLFDGITTALAEHGADGLGILFVIQRALPLLPDGARIVDIGSAATRIANPLRIGCTVTKAALAALAPSLANALGRRGITVNTVEAGVLLTDMTAGWTGWRRSPCSAGSASRGTPPTWWASWRARRTAG